jgi:hypothetical protein
MATTALAPIPADTIFNFFDRTFDHSIPVSGGPAPANGTGPGQSEGVDV